jgi:hypothetical protein
MHSLALKSDGTVWAWGQDSFRIPTQVAGLAGVSSIAAGGSHNLVLKTDTSVWAWWYNFYGQLGDGTTTTRAAPVQTIGMAGTVHIAAGTNHSLALKADGTVWAWGDNLYGQIGDGTRIERLTPVKVGFPQAPALVFARPSYKVRISGSGATALIAEAIYTDDYGSALPVAITYSLTSPYPGVSINASTGEVTVQPSAQSGRAEIRAAYGSLRATADLVLIGSVTDSAINLATTQGAEYLVTVGAQDVASFAGSLVTVTYDPSALQLLDIAEQAYGTYVAAGAIPGTGITVASVAAGSISLVFDAPVPQGKAWTGAMTVLRFRALASGATTVNASQEA